MEVKYTIIHIGISLRTRITHHKTYFCAPKPLVQLILYVLQTRIIVASNAYASFFFYHHSRMKMQINAS